jgi:hypothetical protein
LSAVTMLLVWPPSGRAAMARRSSAVSKIERP